VGVSVHLLCMHIVVDSHDLLTQVSFDINDIPENVSSALLGMGWLQLVGFLK